MFSRDDRSGRWSETLETERLDASVAELTKRIREVTQLVRAIAPMMSELQALQEASAQLTSIDLRGFQHALAEPAGPAQPPAVGASVADVAPPQLPTPLATRSEPAPAPGPARLGDGRTVRVTIARLSGPLEPVRIRRGLATLAGVRDVALVERQQNRLTVALDTDQAPDRLPISEALSMVFDQDVQGEWTGEREYLAVIEGAEETPGDT
jgi:hypothetical protein